MATTIVTKSGSGAPTASDLVAGELAVDLTNKRLYTEDSGGTVLELGTNPSGNVTFGDNGKAIFGAGSDLQIYHDGSSSTSYFIESNATGNMEFRASSLRLKEGDGGNYYFLGVAGGASTVYHNGSAKLATTATGIDVTGSVTADGLTVDGSAQINGDASTDGLVIQNPLSGSFYNAKLEFMRDSTTGGAKIQSERNSSGGVGLSVNVTSSNTAEVNGTYTKALNIAHNGDISFYEDTGTTPKFFWDASAESLGIGTSNSLGVLTIKAPASDDQDIITITEDGINQAFSINGNFAGSGSTGNAITLDSYWVDDIISFSGDGNVGIGTSSPASPTGFGSSGILHLKGATGNDCSIVLEGLSGSGGRQEIGASGGALQFYRGAATGSMSESMRIDASGNLLVGKTSQATSTIGAELGSSGYVSGSRDGNTAGFFNRATSDGEVIRITKDGTTVGSIATQGGRLSIGSGDVNLNFNASANSMYPISDTAGTLSTGVVDLGAALAKFKDLHLSGVSYNGDGSAAAPSISFGADTNTGFYRVGSDQIGFVTAGTIKAKLDASGHLLINEPTSYAAETVQIQCLEAGGNAYGIIIKGPLTSNTAMRFFNSSGSGVTAGSITFSASATSYNTSSDYRLKENVVGMSGATERLKQLKPSRFNFIADADTTVDGFLAHEVQDIVPEAITGTKDAVDADGNPDYQGIDQSKLVPLLVATIQELEARIAALES